MHSTIKKTQTPKEKIHNNLNTLLQLSLSPRNRGKDKENEIPSSLF
jgi:hypothetical protein